MSEVKLALSLAKCAKLTTVDHGTERVSVTLYCITTLPAHCANYYVPILQITVETRFYNI